MDTSYEILPRLITLARGSLIHAPTHKYSAFLLRPAEQCKSLHMYRAMTDALIKLG